MVWNVRLPNAEYYTADDPRLAQVIAEVAAEPEVAIDTETTGLTVWKDVPLFFSLAWGNRRMCLPAEALQRFKHVFDDPEKKWVLANAKYDQHILANVGCALAGKLLDTQVMHALLYDEHPHSLDYMGKQLLGWQWKDMFEDWDKKKQPNVGDFLLWLFATDPTKLTEYASNDAYGTMQIYRRLKRELEEAVTFSLYPDRYHTMWDYFYKIEVPFTRALWKCERNGILIDVPYLANIAEKAGEDLKAVEREVTKIVGYPINLNSRVQLSKYFFDELKLRPLGYSDGGKRGIKVPQVNYDFLEHYAPKVPAAKAMLKYNDLSKLKGTYADGLPKFLDRHNRIHTRFNQDVARCMPAGELVLTSRGYLPVEQVQVGDQVITHQGRARPVVEVSTHFHQPIYVVELGNGLVLRTTGNHQYLLADTTWARADALKPGDEVITHSDEEKWLLVAGWDNYSVSSWGRVRSNVTGCVLAAQPKGKWGHLKVTLSRHGAQKRGKDRRDFGVHQLVAAAFCPANAGVSREVRHIDGIAWNNTQENLLWGTSKENTEDSRRHGTLNGAPMLTPAQVEEIRGMDSAGQPPSVSAKLTFAIAEEVRTRFAVGEGRAELAREFGVSYPAIDNIVKDRTWRKPPGGVSATELAEKYGISPAAIRDIWAGRRWDRDLSEKVYTQQFCRVPVESIYVAGEEPTYGLTVEEDHSHVTGGIVTHNTGRLSSASPNLQNIPNAEQDPWQIRAAFIAKPGHTLIDFDYSALEMRLLAAASMEPGMIQAFKDGLDPHSFNASSTFNLPYADIVKAKKKDKKDLDDYDKRCLKARSDVKTTVGFGVLYGMKEKSLALRLGCSEQDASILIEAFMARNPAVAQFMTEALEETRRTGYAYTILGRRRYLPEILSPNRNERGIAERAAGNLPIQGSAADAAKMAMILIDEADLETRFGSRMLIQVHDEIISECPDETADEAMEEIRMWMEHPFPTDLAVELKTEGKKAKDWASAK